MVTVPIVEKDTKLNPVGTAGKLQSVGNPYIALKTDGLTSALQGMMNDYNESKRKFDILEAQKKINDWEAENLYDTNKGAYAKKGAQAMDVAKPTTESFAKFGKEISDGYTDADTKQRVSEMVEARRSSMQVGLLQHQTGETRAAVVENAAASRRSNADRAVLNYNNQQAVNTAIASMNHASELEGQAKGWTQQVLDDAKADNVSVVTFGIFKRISEESPSEGLKYFNENFSKFRKEELLSAASMIKPIERGIKTTKMASTAVAASRPGATPADIIKNTIRLEGGAELVEDTGGVTKYGISKNANPDVDVENLTEEQATEIYRERYYDAAGIGDLPENMRAIAFDTVVNHGVGTGKLLIRASGNDPATLLQLRAVRYQELAQSDKYSKYLKGWNNRLADLAQMVNADLNAMPDEAKAYQYILDNEQDPLAQSEAWTKTKNLIDTYKTKRKEMRDTAEDTYFKYVNAGQEAPAHVIAQLDPKRYHDIVKGKKDPLLTAKLRDMVLNGDDVVLSDFRAEIGDEAFQDLVKLQKDPVAASDARSVDSLVKDNLTIILQGNTKIQSEEDVGRIEAFKRKYNETVADWKQRNGGSNPSQKDVDIIRDRLLLNVVKDPDGVFGGTNMPYFMTGTKDKVAIDGIPYDVRYYMKDTDASGRTSMREANYGEIIGLVTKVTTARGLQLTNENILETYNRMKANGTLTWR